MHLLTADTPVTQAALVAIAHMPTEHVPLLADAGFWAQMDDAAYMRVAILLAQKSFDEGGCPIGAVIVAADGSIAGKGHNTLGQENDSTTHGETAALRDAGRVAKQRGEGPVDFRPMTLYTTLTPCPVCCAQLVHRANFARVVIGDVTNAPSTAERLKEGVGEVVVAEDPAAIALYAQYAKTRPEQHFLDWGGHRKLSEAKNNGVV